MRQFVAFNELQVFDFNELRLEMLMQTTQQGRPLRGRPGVVNKIGMFSLNSLKSTTCNSLKSTNCRMRQPVEINWSCRPFNDQVKRTLSDSVAMFELWSLP